MIKQLAKKHTGIQKDNILTLILVGLEVVMEVLIPLLMAELIDQGITGGQMNVVVKMGLLLLSAMVSLLFGVLDEPTSSIDTRTETIVQRDMDALMEGARCL